MSASLLALGLYRTTGGPSKSVAAFQRALSAEVIAWVDPVEFAGQPQIWDRCHLVQSSQLPVLRQLGYPQRAGLAEAERIVATSGLVSCHSFWRWHNVWLQRVAARHGVPYWFVPHGGLDPYVLATGQAAKTGFLAVGGRRFLDDARAVVCATEQEYRKLAPLMPRARPAIIPWPLEAADFRDRDPGARHRVRSRLAIPDTALVMLSFGRLHPMKRPLETIAAFAEGAPRDAHLLVVGNESGVTRAECEARAHGLRIADRVHVVGAAFGDERRDYFDAADLYISLSHRENFNFTAAEAIASGLPVMLSPGNDLGPELEAAGCAWRLTDLDSAASAIDAVSGTAAAERSAMGRRGRAWADANLREATFAARIRAFADEIARRD